MLCTVRSQSKNARQPKLPLSVILYKEKVSQTWGDQQERHINTENTLILGRYIETDGRVLKLGSSLNTNPSQRLETVSCLTASDHEHSCIIH